MRRARGLLLVGDAFAFLDPVFSSGVMLALKSGTLAADAVHQAIVEKDFSPGRFAGYGQFLREGVENMCKRRSMLFTTPNSASGN